MKKLRIQQASISARPLLERSSKYHFPSWLLAPHISFPKPLCATKMSWMDSWSRPSKRQATPAPFYLLPGCEATPYCHSCGRVISSRRTGTAAAAAAAEDKGSAKTVVKYCSSRCRGHKPGGLDREIEGLFVRLLNCDGGGGGGGDVEGQTGEGGAVGARTGSGKKTARVAGGGKKERKSSSRRKKRIKGDARVLVSCDEVERYMFGLDGSGSESESASASGAEDGQRADVGAAGSEQAVPPRPTAPQGLPHDHRAPGTGTLEDPTGSKSTAPPVDYDVLARLSVRSGTRVRPPQSVSEVNGSVGGEKGRAERGEETGEMLERRREGLRRARRREMVRCAARRGVVFGFGEGEGVGGRRKCEAVMSGKVVEPSFAKGDWSVRWRE